MRSIVRVGALAFLAAFSFSAHALSLEFTIDGGPICPLQGPCVTSSDAFYDVTTTTFTAEITADGSLSINDPISLAFDGGSQTITLNATSILSADFFNPPVVDGEVPNGNWTGMFDYMSSDGGQGAIDLAPNSGQTFFIDNEDNIFNFSLNGGEGATTINFFVTGSVRVLETPVPVPAAAWFFLSALGSLVVARRRR